MKFPYVSYLRVFEPLDVFDDDQQLLIMSQRGRGRDVTENLDRGDSLRRITRWGLQRRLPGGPRRAARST